ncbi:MAG: SlyX family protein [Methylococcaceae bacterium]|jgi:Uncharacterized protein conserved in bacteria
MDDLRAVELEIKLAYQEDLLQTLNNIVSTQQKQIDRLEATCKLLNEKIKNLADNPYEKNQLEIPPHY